MIWIASSVYSKVAASRKLRQTGIGRGAPGFITNVRKVAIPSHIAARIRAGEDVSADEITEALEEEKERLELVEKLEREEVERTALAAAQESQKKSKSASSSSAPRKVPDTVDQEWLPQGILSSSKGGRRRKN